MHDGKRGKDYPTGKLNTDGMSDKEKIAATYQKYMKHYLRVVAAIDENVGRVLDYLEESGLAENTVVVYTSDQGMFLGEHSYYDKRWMYDESLKMPFIIRKPGEIKPGSQFDEMVTNLNLCKEKAFVQCWPGKHQKTGRNLCTINIGCSSNHRQYQHI